MGSCVPARLPRLIVLSALFAAAAAAPPAIGQAATETTRPDPLVSIDPTTALLIVNPPAGVPDADALLQRRINTHAVTLRSAQNLRRAIVRPNLRETRWFKESPGPDDRVEFLRERLRVAAVPGTALVAVSLDAVRDPAERTTIVTEVCNAYIDAQRNDRGNQLLDRTAMLNNVKIKAEMRLKDLTAELREKQVKLNLDGGATGGRVGVKELELSRLVDQQVEARLRAERAKARLESLQAAVQQGKELHSVAALAENDPELRTLRARAEEADARAEALAATPDAKDPELVQLRSTAERLRKRAVTRHAEALARAKVDTIEQAQAAHEEAAAVLQSINRRVDNLKLDLGELSNALVTYHNLQDEQKALREQLQTIRRQIDTLLAEQSSRDNTDIHWHLTPDPR